MNHGSALVSQKSVHSFEEHLEKREVGVLQMGLWKLAWFYSCRWLGGSLQEERSGGRKKKQEYKVLIYAVAGNSVCLEYGEMGDSIEKNLLDFFLFLLLVTSPLILHCSYFSCPLKHMYCIRLKKVFFFKAVWFTRLRRHRDFLYTPYPHTWCIFSLIVSITYQTGPFFTY